MQKCIVPYVYCPQQLLRVELKLSVGLGGGHQKSKVKSESHSVLSNSLGPHGLKKESEVAQLSPTLSDPMDSSLHQAPPSMGFSRQEYWSRLPFPPPGNLPNPGMEPRSPALQTDALPFEPPRKSLSATGISKYILSLRGLPFHFFDSIVYNQKFLISRSSLTIFSFILSTCILFKKSLFFPGQGAILCYLHIYI